MPEPLLTFTLYDDFLRAVSIQDRQDQAQTVYAIIEQLPPANYQLLERLLFHLARVAHHEHDNRMSPNALAIVFAPCILRTDRDVAAQVGEVGGGSRGGGVLGVGRSVIVVSMQNARSRNYSGEISESERSIFFINVDIFL